MGGREIIDLRIERPVLQLNTTIAHMRRGEKVGKAMLITLIDTQAEIGTSMSFYTLNPDQYNYGDQHTRWRYTWRVTYSMKLNMKIGKMWVPTTNYGNNRNIMETAAADSTFLGETKWCLKIINQCRLYLKIFFVSEMMGKDGKITMD